MYISFCTSSHSILILVYTTFQSLQTKDLAGVTADLEGLRADLVDDIMLAALERSLSDTTADRKQLIKVTRNPIF